MKPFQCVAYRSSSRSAACIASTRSFTFEGQPATTACKQAIVTAEATDKLKMPAETCFVQHPPGIAANRKDAPRLDIVMLVQYHAARMIGYGAAINDRLPIVLTGGFQAVQLEQAIGRRIKTDIAGDQRKLRVGNVQRPVSNQPRIGKALPMCNPQKIVPVQRAAQTLAVHYRVIANLIRHAPVGVHIREVKFTARPEQAMHLAQYSILVRRQVDHTVRHDDIEAV